MKKISVVVGTYNGQKFIEGQLDSIRLQTRKADEVLIVDDCSVDLTFDTVSDYISKYSLDTWKIKVNKKNKGFAQNFYDGISLTNGEVVFVADQDDIWTKDKLEKMTAIIENDDNINVLCGGFKPFFEGDIDFATKSFWKIQELLSKYDGKVKKKLFEKKGVFTGSHGWTLGFRKEFFEKIKEKWSQGYSHDSFLCINAALEDSIFEYRYVTGYFRKHRESTTAYQGSGSHEKKVEKEINTNKIYLKRINDILLDLKVRNELQNREQKEKIAKQQQNFFELRNRFYYQRSIANLLKMLRFGHTINKAWIFKDILYALKG